MGSGGGGGDGGMMMMIMMMQQQQQMEEQRRQQAAQMLAQSQRAESQNYQRYTDNIAAQNKKVGDQWDLYNANIDKILKINPQYREHQKYTFNPYAVDNSYKKSTNQGEADANTDLLNQFYSKLDKMAFDDFNMAKSQYDQSKNWVTAAQAAADNAASKIVPGALPGTWGAGGNQVSGGAGADLDGTGSGTDVGGTNDGLYNIAGASPGTAPASNFGTGSASGVGVGTTGASAGTGFLSDESSPSSSPLAGLFGNAVSGATTRRPSVSSIF